MNNKKIIFAGLVFAVFFAVALSANSVNAAFWDWFRAGDDNVAAVAKATKVSLNVQKQGKGVITSDDGKINCGTDCKEVYFSGGSIHLYATSAKGFAFDKWTGNACGDSIGIGISTSTEITIGQCQVPLNYNKNKILTAKAYFKKISKEIDDWNTPSTATDGTATDNGNTSSAYAGRSSAASSYTLKVNKSGGKGNVSDGGRLNCGRVCVEKYWPSSEVKLRAVPDGGYVFKNFTPEKECASSYGNHYEAYCVTTMDKNKIITVVFKKSPPGKSSSSSQKGSSSTSSDSNSKSSKKQSRR